MLSVPAAQRKGPSITAVTLVVLTLLWSPAALAQVRVVITEVVLEGDLTADTEAAVVDAASAGLRSTASSVASQGAGDIDAEAAFAITVVQLAQHYTVEAVLRRTGEGGAELGRSSEECTACAWSEALETVTRAAQETAAALPGILAIEVTPPGAALTIDGTAYDAGEPALVSPGTHRVEVRHDGFLPATREVAVAAGERSELSISMERSLRPGGRVAAWILGAAGLAALVPGVVWLAVDGRCPIDWEGDGVCPEVYDTWPQGLGLTLGAAALLATSAVLFVSSARARRRDTTLSLTVVPAPGGTFASVRGLF